MRTRSATRLHAAGHRSRVELCLLHGFPHAGAAKGEGTESQEEFFSNPALKGGAHDMDDFAINPGSLTGSDLPMRRSDLALDLQQWTRALEQATQEAAQSPVGEAKARALLTAARAHWHLDDFLACLKVALQCLANRDLDTPASIAVHAMTLAAFALNELGAPEQARILAQRALVQTRLEFLFDLLPTALSCAAHIESCNGNLERAETLHLEAIQHARDSTDNNALQLALGNLLMSYINLLRSAQSNGNASMAEAVKQRSRRHIAQARRLKEDPSLSQWRRLSLQQDLGELLGLCGEQQEAEHLLRECLEQSIEAGDPYSTQAIATPLAEQLEKRGEFQEALGLLSTYVHPENPRRGSYGRRLQATRTAESCLRHLRLGDDVTGMSERIAEDLREWEFLRKEATQCLLAAGYPVDLAG